MTDPAEPANTEFDLLYHSLLWGLEEEHWAWLREQVSYHRSAKDVLRDLDLDRVVLMMDGHVAILHDDRVDRMEEGACVLGLFESATRVRGKMSFRAISPLRYYMMSRTAFRSLLDRSPAVRDNVARTYEEEIRRLYREQNRMERSLEDFFISGNAGMVPGPYRAHGVKMFIFLMEDRHHEMDKRLGKDLQLIPAVLPGFGKLANRYMIVHADFHNVTSEHEAGRGHFFDYAETAIFIPTFARRTVPGAFCPELYPDSYLAIAIGRELYGFPKRYGRTWIHDQDHWNFIDLVVDGKHLARASWQKEEPLNAEQFGTQAVADFIGPSRLADPLSRIVGGMFGKAFGAAGSSLLRTLWPSIPVHVRREVPKVGPTDHIELATDELVMIPFNLLGMRDFQRLEMARVEFPTEGAGPSQKNRRRCLTPLDLGGTCLSAFRVELDMEFSRTRVLKKYR